MRILIVDKDSATVNFLQFELKKAGFEVSAASGGKEGMILAWRDRPHAIIIDPTFTDMPVAEFVQKLRGDARTSNRILIAFSSLRDPQEIQHTIELGFNQYYTKEGDALPMLLKSLSELSERKVEDQHVTDRPSRPRADMKTKEGRLVVFLSAKGGTGTSSMCANIAASLAQIDKGASIAVVDLVLPMGSIASLVGYEGPLNVVEATRMTISEATPAYFQDAMPKIGAWGFQLLAGSPDPGEANDLDPSRIPVILNSIRQSFDYLFVDIGRSLSRITLPIILVADQVLLVMSTDKAAIDLTLKTIKYLESKGLEREQLYPLINRAVGLEGLSKSETEKTIGMTIPGSFPFIGGNFALANNQHVPIFQKFPGEMEAIAMREMTVEVQTKLKKRVTQPISVSRS
ncbi:MAG: response regulator [Anaerolineae bacterium]|nr:MAG: response regulator [Anaerolineae bacterium]